VDGVNERMIREPYFVPDLLVDATGVGGPVIDLIREPLRDRVCRLAVVTFTAGSRLEPGPAHWELRMPKAHLVSRLQSLLQLNRIHMGDYEEMRALARELADYELRVTDNARVTAGAFKSGTHDDLATALGLAVLLPFVRRQWRFVEPGQL